MGGYELLQGRSFTDEFSKPNSGKFPFYQMTTSIALQMTLNSHLSTTACHPW